MKKDKILFKAAKEGGKVLEKYFGSNIKVKIKLTNADLQTEADLESEKAILKILKNEFPSYNIWSEECGYFDKKSDYTFVLDPLDGTNNFVLGIPQFSVALALLYKKEPVYSIIYNPVTEQLFHAERGKGAYLNNKRIKVNNVSDVKKSSVSYMTTYINSKGYKIKLFANLYKLNIKRLLENWSMALDFCMLASGKIEAIILNRSELYDYIAGKLIAQEAGAKITGFNGKDKLEKYDEFVASNGTAVHNKMIKALPK